MVLAGTRLCSATARKEAMLLNTKFHQRATHRHWGTLRWAHWKGDKSQVLHWSKGDVSPRFHPLSLPYSNVIIVRSEVPLKKKPREQSTEMILNRITFATCPPLSQGLQNGNFQDHRWDGLCRRRTLHLLLPIQRARPQGGPVRIRVEERRGTRQRHWLGHPQWTIEAHASTKHATTTNNPKGGIGNASLCPLGIQPRETLHTRWQRPTCPGPQRPVGRSVLGHSLVRQVDLNPPAARSWWNADNSDWARHHQQVTMI